MTPKLFTVNEVARLLQVCPRTVQRRIQRGKLTAFKPNGGIEWRVRAADLDAYLGRTGRPRAGQGRTGQPRHDEPCHYTQIDVEMEMRRRMEAIQNELISLRMEDEPIILIDAETLWHLEALGYVVDLHSGMVSRPTPNGEEA